jgi:hypothetical protein
MHDPPVFQAQEHLDGLPIAGSGLRGGKRSPASCVACVSPGADIEGLAVATPGTNRLAAFVM